MEQSHLLPAGQILSLWGEAAERLLTHDDGDACLLYLHILKKNKGFPDKWALSRVRQAQGVLLSLGLLPKEFQGELQPPDHVAKQVSVTPPEYTTADVNLALDDGGSEFKQLSENVEAQLGKPLNLVDLKMLLEIYEHLELPVEVILMVVTTCVRQQELAKTTRRSTNLKAIKSEACRWQNRGILTLERAMDYTAQLSKLSHVQASIIQIFHLNRNHFTEKEQNYIKQWMEWGFELDVYPRVYEICLESTKDHNFSFSYADGIFKNWHKQNLHRLEEVIANDSQFHNMKRPSQSYHSGKKGHAHSAIAMNETTPPSPELAKQMQEELEAMKRKLGKGGV